MLEIYNEEYKDLLSKSLPAGKKHQVGWGHKPAAFLTSFCPWRSTKFQSVDIVVEASCTALPQCTQTSCAYFSVDDNKLSYPL